MKQTIQKRIDAILMNPDFSVETTEEDKTTAKETVDAVLDEKRSTSKVLVPQGEGELYATAIALAERTTEENFERVAAYCLRLFENDCGEYAALALREAFKTNRDFTKTKAYISLMTTSDLGKAIAGGTEKPS